MGDRRFWKWFEVEMIKHGYRSVRQVERAGGVGNDTISSRHRHELPPTDTVIRAIARAFDFSFEKVQKVADGGPIKTRPALREPGETSNLTLRELWAIVNEMTVEDQRAVLDYALFRQTRSDRQEREQPPHASAASQQNPAASEGGG